MDVAAMHGLAHDFERTAKEINGLVLRVNGDVHRGIFEWLGDVAVEYSNFWRLRSKVQLLAIELHLLGLARGLRAQIAAQERASAPSAGLAMACTQPRDDKPSTYAHGMLRITPGARFRSHGPTSVNDLLDPLKNDDKLGHSADPHSVYHYPGGIAVQVMGEPPNRHVIVTISGTRQLGAGGSDPDDLVTNLGNLVGLDTEKQHAIEAAMQRAGVTPDDKVMLVGHSMGGADAIAFASDHAGGHPYRIVRVVTVDAPPTPRDTPSGVKLLAIEGSHDLVTRAGYEGSSRGHEATVVPVPEPLLSSPLTNHDPAFIQSHLASEQSTLDAFKNDPANKDFFSGQESTTQMYSNERTPMNPLRYLPGEVPSPGVLRTPGQPIAGAL